VISDCLIRAYNKKAGPAPIQAPISKVVQEEKVQAFVDDTACFLIVPNENGISIAELLRHNTQLWEDLLHATGGKLELPKCKFFLFKWRYSKDGTATLDKDIITETLSIRDRETDKNMLLNYLPHHEAYKLLGVHIAFDGNSTTQIEKMEEKCTRMASVFKTCPLSGNDVRQGYNSIFCPAIRYCLPATTIESSVLSKMQNKVIASIIPKLGFNTKFPRAVVYAPEHFGGLGMLRLDVEQGITHVMSALGHIRAETLLGQHIMTLLESYQMATGMCGNPLSNIIHQTHVDAPWLETLREFLHSIQATIRIPSLATINPLRQFDKCIMIHAIKSKLFSSQEMRMINNCRMFLQVNFLSEISTGDGQRLLPSAYNGEQDAMNKPVLWSTSVSTILWPYQPAPCKVAWGAWQKCLNLFIRSKSMFLIQQLGKWLPSYDDQRTWIYKGLGETIYQLHNEEYRTYFKSSSSTRRFHVFQYTGIPASTARVPHRACPVTPVQIDEYKLRLHGYTNDQGIIDVHLRETEFPFEGDDITIDQNALDLLLQSKVITIARMANIQLTGGLSQQTRELCTRVMTRFHVQRQHLPFEVKLLELWQ
jgi:hypothetical protein